jgi:hypothetical protein
MNACFHSHSDLIFNLHAETPAPAEEKRLATWGTDVPDDLVLDQNQLTEALKKVNLGSFNFSASTSNVI